MSQVRDRVETAAGKSNMGNNISTLTTQVMDDAIQPQYKVIKTGYQSHTQDRTGR